MFAHIFLAIVAFMTLNLASAWHLTPEHTDGFYGITQDEEIHLIMEWNDTIASKFKPQNSNSFRTAHSKRGTYLPAGSLECGGGYVNANNLASCLAQAEAWCGLGTVGTGAKITDYTAYAWKSGLVFLYVCDWNWHWFYTGSTTCFSAEVAAAIGLVENHCGYGSGKTQIQAGWYLIDDWKIGFGYQVLGVDGCKGLKGNHDGKGTNPKPKIIAQSLPQGGPTSTNPSQLPSGLSPVLVTSTIAITSSVLLPSSVSGAPPPSSAPAQSSGSLPASSAPAHSSGSPPTSSAPALSSAVASSVGYSSSSYYSSSFIF